jgi:hypothetical protein
MTLAISPRMCMRPSAPAFSAASMISSVMPAILMSICSAVTPFGGAGHLEVHVAQVILVAEDVGQHREAVAFLDQAHGDAGHRRLDRHAGVHQRQASRRTPSRHRARAVRLGDLGDHAHGVGELVLVGSTACTRAGQLAVADLAALRAHHHAGLADAVRREVVVQHEVVLVLPSSASMICASRRCRAW